MVYSSRVEVLIFNKEHWRGKGKIPFLLTGYSYKPSREPSGEGSRDQEGKERRDGIAKIEEAQGIEICLSGNCPVSFY